MSAAAVAEAVAAFGSERRQVRFLYFVTVGTPTPTPTSTIMAADQRRGLLELAQRLSRELGQRVLLVHDPAVERPPTLGG